MGIFDLPGVRDTEDPPPSDEDEESPGRGEGHEDDEASGDLDSLRRQVAELQRRDRERESEMMSLVARNTVLETQRAQPPEPKKKMTPAELKAWAESDEGDELSAAVHYVDQKAEDIEERIAQKIASEERRGKLRQSFIKTLPDLADPHSPVSREVASLAEQKFVEGVGTNKDEAYVAALVDIAANKGIRTVKEPKEPPEDYNRRRRVESSGGTGAGSGQPTETKTLTEEHLKMARQFGLTDVFSDNKAVRNRARQNLLDEINAETDRHSTGRF